MRLVIADTGPVNYLILIGQVDILPRLFDRIVLPTLVQTELSDRKAPIPVQSWICNPPAWLEIVNAPSGASFVGIHQGEAAAIALASFLHADLLLMDDRRGVSVAKQQGLRVTGTLGVLDLAATRGLLDFRQAIVALEQTSFRRPDGLLKALLTKHKQQR